MDLQDGLESKDASSPKRWWWNYKLNNSKTKKHWCKRTHLLVLSQELKGAAVVKDTTREVNNCATCVFKVSNPISKSPSNTSRSIFFSVGLLISFDIMSILIAPKMSLLRNFLSTFRNGCFNSLGIALLSVTFLSINKTIFASGLSSSISFSGMCCKPSIFIAEHISCKENIFIWFFFNYMALSCSVIQGYRYHKLRKTFRKFFRSKGVDTLYIGYWPYETLEFYFDFEYITLS